MVERFDIFTAKKPEFDSNRNLIINATPTRAGVFFYLDQSGNKVGELRHPDDVFSKDTLDSLNSIPYTTQENHVSLFTPEDTTGKAYGVTLNNARQDGNMTALDIKVWDKKEQDSILGGDSLELSVGYRCDVVDESGTFDGIAYEKRQINIRGNHIARVKKARGGESCRFRLDSQDSRISGIEADRLHPSGETQNHSKGETMSEKTKVIQRELPLRESGKFKLDAQDIEIDEAQKSIIETFLGRENKLFTALKDSNTELTQKSVKMDSLTAENKTLVKNAENSIPSEKMDQEIDKRVNLYKMADESKIKDYKSMSIKDLSKQIVKQSGLFNDEKLDSDEYVNFALEHMQDDHTQKVLKSRKNLTLHKGIKFDDPGSGESQLEKAL